MWNGSKCVTAECAEGDVRGEQECNGCGTQTTKKCVKGKWVDELGECNQTEEECEEKDCCDEGFKGSFTDCLAKKYGYDSAEYLCAKDGSFNPYYDQVGCASGAVVCSMALGLGSNVENLIPKSWVSGGFKKYACTKEKPKIDSSGSTSTGGSGDAGTCKVQNVGGTFLCGGAERTSCPSNIESCSWAGTNEGDTVQCSSRDCPEKRETCYSCWSANGEKGADQKCQKRKCS